MVQRINVLQFAVGQYAVCAAVSLLLGLWLERGLLPQVMDGAWAIAYTGLVSVGVGYTLQAVAQRVAPPADAAIILSAEAVFAALSGWVFLGEGLTPVQLLGCGAMFAGMLLAQSDVWLKRYQGDIQG
jgi:drug/metabolite transporter (DMT)-like permease